MLQGFSHLSEGSGKKVSLSCLPMLMAKYMSCLFGCCFAFKTSEVNRNGYGRRWSQTAAEKMLSGYPLSSYSSLLTPQICASHQLWWLSMFIEKTFQLWGWRHRRYWWRIGTSIKPIYKGDVCLMRTSWPSHVIRYISLQDRCLLVKPWSHLLSDCTNPQKFL